MADQFQPESEVRVRDPASRDQDSTAWRRGRFAERVRREWNPVATATIEATRTVGEDGYDLGALAEAIRARVGGDLDHIRERLEQFARLEEMGMPAQADPLLRPGQG